MIESLRQETASNGIVEERFLRCVSLIHTALGATPLRADFAVRSRSCACSGAVSKRNEPALDKNEEQRRWIPAFAGMTTRDNNKSKWI